MPCFKLEQDEMNILCRRPLKQYSYRFWIQSALKLSKRLSKSEILMMSMDLMTMDPKW